MNQKFLNRKKPVKQGGSFLGKEFGTVSEMEKYALLISSCHGTNLSANTWNPSALRYQYDPT